MLIYDYTNLIEENIGKQGISWNLLQERKKLLSVLHEEIKEKQKDGTFSFLDLPIIQPELDKMKKFAADAKGKWENILVLGIGGSSLGARALFQALCHPFYNLLSPTERNGYPRIFFADNVDPELMQSFLDILDLKKTLFLVISKSGTTAETLAQFLLFLEIIEKKGNLKEQIVIITDPEKGPLREISKEGFFTFSIPPKVVGRYSVLTPVGLLPAILVGINIEAVLEGAKIMYERCQKIENPAYLYALTHFLFLEKGKNIHVIFPYTQALMGLAEWWCQLWAESLGKEEKGPTPVRALGVTDQHSQLQLYMEGPYDKVITFFVPKKYRKTISIPHSFKEISAFNYLSGHTFNELIQAEQLGTEAALSKAGRPNAKFVFEKIDAFTIGEIFLCLELATVAFGLLMKVNPLNQPGVELGKRYTKALMGHPEWIAEKPNIESPKCIIAKV